jgi:hypothetical protein
MRRLLGILMISFGMLLITGFSSTTDLTENSIVVFAQDIDVGVDAIVVDQRDLIVTNSKVVTTVITDDDISNKSLGRINTLVTAYFESPIHRVYINDEVPNYSLFDTTIKNYTKTLHRRARDGIIC